MDEVWSARDTTPGAIEAALRELLKQRHQENEAYAPARVLNLVVIADADFRGEVENRLERVGRYHPSRTVVCAVEPGRTTMDAWASMACDIDPQPGSLAVCREQVELKLGPGHLRTLHTVVGSLLVSDLATLVWSPHGYAEAVDALSRLAQVVLIDSLDEPDVGASLSRAEELAGRAYVVDLAWLRSTPWRERIAATFDPPAWRRSLQEISSVTVRHRHDSAAAGVLFLGWLYSRLGWRSAELSAGRAGELSGRARARRGEVAIRLEPVAQQGAPGLGGVTVQTASGGEVSLDRSAGGLRAVKRRPRGETAEWTLLGASRGESGILGEGVRQALLRDPTYRPALAAARAMVA